MFNCSGILFNHESPRRGINFVTRKITHGLKRVALGKQSIVSMGNLDSQRDWGHAKDYVKAMYMMLQHDNPDDYVVSTGELHTVREFIEITGKHYDMDIVWQNKGIYEIGIDRKKNVPVINVDPYFYRPAEVQILLGDSSKIRNNLSWRPEYDFESLIEDMCANEKGE
jgi:GDPmannose 4,6-dehydratase